MKKPKAPRLLRPSEAAAALGVSYQTIHRWIRAGHVPTVKTTSGRDAVSSAWLDAEKARLASAALLPVLGDPGL